MDQHNTENELNKEPIPEAATQSAEIVNEEATYRMPDETCISFGLNTQEQFLSLTEQAAISLGWEVVSTFKNEMILHISDADDPAGKTVSLFYDGSKAYFGKPGDTYEAQQQNILRRNLLNEAILKVIRDTDEIRKKVSGDPRSIIQAFSINKGFFVTPVLAGINTLVFIIMVCCGVSAFSPQSQSLIDWGGDFTTLNKHGEVWRLVTNIFLHAGLVHLLMNMYCLLYIGNIMERIIGPVRFAFIYILSGVFGSLLSDYFNPFTVCVGASGAIFGLFGAFVALLLTNHFDKATRQRIMANMLLLIVYNLANGMKSNIDNAAHIGGLVSGFLMGVTDHNLTNLSISKAKLWTRGLIMTLITIAMGASMLWLMKDEYQIYTDEMQRFQRMESMALEVLNLDSQNATKERIFDELNNRGIYYWDESIKLLNGLAQLKLPARLRTINTEMIHYCELRIKCYGLLSKKISENTDNYDWEIKQTNHEIQQIMDQLK